MEKYIVEKYKIDFVNRIKNWGGTQDEIDKFPNSNSSWLTSMLWEWKDVNDLDDPDGGLLHSLETAIKDPNAEIESGSYLVDIVIYHDRVDFYPKDTDPFSIPTLELKSIVAGWKDFLLIPPLDGTKV